MNPNSSVSLPDTALPEHQIRERAYFRWIDLDRPHGDDQAHWFWAREQLAAELVPPIDSPTSPEPAPEHFSIRRTLASGASDPTHRYHAPATAHDARLDVVAGEARQRVRGRHFDSSLRAQPKKPAR